ncbi:N-6 DNA methylase [Corallococcus praedator]|uniref:site-specific DNA-methyltransferase (adenine-specific) n=1 Tax=Corallococcus praedator TaxID=2316724 RepID=A0ABX9QMV3_9BACT|nr:MULTISPECIES: XkdF-like putative serine protease domain-containing protein [Corallococcus]RKH35655.1 N-6 DNA methylase [Corallococcus sp. CA031C]RKI13340.1 N-6 DNA methylase [Corallococcus praedator]
MGNALTKTLARARHVLESLQGESVEKTIWGSPAGKKRLAKRLVAMLPAHKTYVEPFAGSAAVLFEKAPSDVEAINDADTEIADAYRLLQKLTPAGFAKLKKLPWVGDEKTFKSLFDAKPKGDVERLHRFLYLTHFSYGKLRGRSFSPNGMGVEAKTLARIEQFAPRLKRVKVYGGDYEKVVRKYDGKDTVLFLDPPYPGYNVDVGEGDFDEERFYAVLKSLKGRWLMTYGIRGKLPGMLKGSGFLVKRIRTPRTIAAMRGVGGSSVLTQLLVSNYQPAAKALEGDGDFAVDDWQPEEPPGTAPFATTTSLLKGVEPDDERYVLGVVLEPETVDAQGDIYSAAEIRQAAHRFMEEFGGLGLMHQMRVNGHVKVLESYLAPVDFNLGEVPVRKGTWLLAVRVLSDELWGRVKDGQLTGFSIGGTARRLPEAAPATEQPPSDTPAADSQPEAT